MRQHIHIRKLAEVRKQVIIVCYTENEHMVGSKRTHHLSEFLGEKGAEVQVIARDRFSSKDDFLQQIKAQLSVRPDALIVVSVGPFDFLSKVSRIALKTGNDYIVDMRDPWSFAYRSERRGSLLKRTLVNIWRIYRRKSIQIQERRIYKHSAFFIVATTGMKELYSTIFPDIQKIKVIPNGFDFDPSSIQITRKRSDNHSERFICVGKLIYYSREKFLQIIDLLEKRIEIFSQAIEVVIIGSESNEIRNILNSIEISPSLKFTLKETMVYEEVLKEIANADAGFLILRDESFEVGTKVYDYIGLGLPVLDSFEEGSAFERQFNNFLFRFDQKSLERRDPDLSFHRSNILNENLDVFT